MSHLLTAEEAAAVLRMSPSWVYQAAGRGALPCVRLGRALRFDEATLRKWLESQTANAVVVPLRGLR